MAALINLGWRYMTWSHGGSVIVGDEPTHRDEPAASRRGAVPGSPSLAVERDHAPASQPLAPESDQQPEPGVPVTHNDSQ